jgi:hypothetical protein
MEQQCSRCREVVMQEFTKDMATEGFSRYRSQTFYSVLCLTCAEYLMALFERVQGHRVPAVGDPLQEGFHYEMEGTNLVFTEAYHMMRGHCCQSGCKHCVYGFKAPYAT